MSKRALLTTAILALAALASLAAAPGLEPVLLQRTGTGVAFAVTLPHDGVRLSVSDPDGEVFSRDFVGLDTPAFSLTDERGLFRGDGEYTWEVRLSPVLGPSARKEMAEARERGDEAALRDLQRLYLPPYPMVYSGAFRVERGNVVYDPYASEPETGRAAPPREGALGDTAPRTSSASPTPLDVVHADDVIVTMSVCVGVDCATDGSENFGFDTIRMKENNTRLAFVDTSTSGTFPTRDWRLRANSSTSGGQSAFYIDDMGDASTGGDAPTFSPFAVEAATPNNTLYLDSTGRVGFGTATPVLRLHALYGDTPGIRLEQDGSIGYSPRTWDIAGNEANFFIRDITGGSQYSFRIQPGAPTNTLTLRADRRIGLGTWAPSADLEIQRTGAEVTFLLNRTDTTGTPWTFATSPDGLILNPATDASSFVFQLGSTGDLLLSGVLTQGSSREIKSACAAFGPGLLEAVAQLPVQLWSYTADAAGTRHAGPMAEDFYRLFGLGADDRHVAPSDVAGVTLAAVQEIIQEVREKDAQLESLRAENAALAQRLAKLEALLGASPTPTP